MGLPRKLCVLRENEPPGRTPMKHRYWGFSKWATEKRAREGEGESADKQKQQHNDGAGRRHWATELETTGRLKRTERRLKDLMGKAAESPFQGAEGRDAWNSCLRREPEVRQIQQEWLTTTSSQEAQLWVSRAHWTLTDRWRLKTWGQVTNVRARGSLGNREIPGG